MKNYIKKIGIAFLMLTAFSACEEDENEFGPIVTPTNLQVDFTILGIDGENPDGDGSGLVNFTASADNAISYRYIFSDGVEVNSQSGIIQKRFNNSGTNTYTVTVLANGTGGVSTSTTLEVTVFSNFNDPETVLALTGGATKVWYWAAAEPGHLGVGQNDGNADLNFYPNYYAATPFEKAGSPNSSCLYENVLTFSLVDGIIKYQLNNGGKTFFNIDFLSVGGGSGSEDLCLDYDTSGEKTVILEPSNSVVASINSTGTTMSFSDGGFMGYYIGTSTYEILSITENRMEVRAVMGGNPALAWYHIFTTEPPVQGGDDDFTDLVFSDEFDVAGAPDPSKWSYNLGAGGWGNNEAQHYTDDAQNVIVQGGSLVITAKKQNFSGSQYTSARLVSENKFEFTYGKVEFRAKLPSGAGTWPALWMLGENYATNQWPACGEIDVMEHVGNQPNTIHGTLHYPGNSGGNANTGTTTVATASTEFHIYSVTWSPTSIKFYVDGNLYHSYANVAGSPFNADFFLIMNVAMGGTFGGTIDPGFIQSTMEVDYVRVYQ